MNHEQLTEQGVYVLLQNEIAKVDLSTVEDGMLIISPYFVMKTCAYYAGRMCAEYDEGYGDWIIQPYDRASEYFNEPEIAQEFANFWNGWKELEDASH